MTKAEVADLANQLQDAAEALRIVADAMDLLGTVPEWVLKARIETPTRVEREPEPQNDAAARMFVRPLPFGRTSHCDNACGYTHKQVAASLKTVPRGVPFDPRLVFSKWPDGGGQALRFCAALASGRNTSSVTVKRVGRGVYVRTA